MNVWSFVFGLLCLAIFVGIYCDNRSTFRQRFTHLLRFKVGLGGLESEFAKELDQVEDQQAVITQPKQLEAPKPLALEAPTPPAYIVQKAWLNVRQALARAAGENFIPRVNLDKSGDIMSGVLFDRIGLTDDDRNVINNLRQLRNEAVHQLDNASLTLTDALRYQDLANNLVQRIDALKRPST